MNTITNHPAGNVEGPAENLRDLNIINSRSLDNLPSEILIRIIENFCAHCVDSPVETDRKSVETNLGSVVAHPEARKRRQTLKDLCLVARKYSAVAQSILHHYYCANTAYSSEANADRLALLLRTVTDRADLANSVKALLLDPVPGHNGHEDTQDSVIQLSQTTAGILDQASRRARIVPSLEHPIASLKTLIVAAASGSLEHLSDTTKESLVPISLPGSITCLPRLRVFNIHVGSSSGCPTYPLLQSFRNLKVLKVSRHFRSDHHDWPAELVTGQARLATVNLRKLTVEALSIHGLYTVLRTCHELRDLEIFVVSAEPYLPTCDWKSEFLQLQLCPLLRSLQRLVFSTNRDISVECTTPIQDSADFTLAGLSKLEILESNWELLHVLCGRNLGISVPTLLPPSLRILHLCTSQDWNRVSAHLQSFVAAKVARHLPELVILCLEYNGNRNTDFPETLPPKIIEQMEQAGIKCSLLYHPRLDYVWDVPIPDRFFGFKLESRFFL